MGNEKSKQTKTNNSTFNTIQPEHANNIKLLLQLSSNNAYGFVLQWYHIGNAIKQELYDKISIKFMNLVNGTTRYKDIDHLLSALSKKMNIDDNEINYLKKLINRAKTCNPLCAYRSRRAANFVWTKIYYLEKELVADIFSVYTCFVFSNFQFQKCTDDDLNKIVTNKIKGKEIQGIDLFPQYVIDDDMYSVWKYLFAASHLVNKIKFKKTKHSCQLITFTIIPNKVVSIYDPDIIYSFS
eukprot:264749_1